MFLRRIALLAVLIVLPLSAQAFSTKAKQAYVLDLSTGTVLYEKNADQIMAPSSMTKIMTAYVVYKLAQQGQISLDEEFRVSDAASKKGGSKMFLRSGERLNVRDLLIGLIILSGNDAAITIAENISGSELAFSQLMNQAASNLGMLNTNFVNPSGWPDPNHYSTAKDIAILSSALIREFPEEYRMFKRRDFKWGGVAQANRNPLLGFIDGADGLKTGSTSAGGYGLAGTAEQDGRRIVVVLNGMTSKDTRRTESRRVINWAMRTFSTYALLKDSQVIHHARVWMGKQDFVPMIAERDLVVTIKKASRENLKAKVVYKGPLEAPIRQGQVVGELLISGPSMEPIRLSLEAQNSVERVNRVMAVARGLAASIWGSDFDGEEQAPVEAAVEATAAL